MRKQLSCIVVLLLTALQFSFAQELIVKGIVTDKDGVPLPGTIVMLKSTQKGVQTDENGYYSVRIPNGGGILQFILMGMQTKEFPVNSSTTSLDVTLLEETVELDDIVVIGYGSGRKLGTVVGSAVKVSSEDLKDRPTSNPLDALQGKVSGLQIFTSSGEPSALSSIRLHGTGSLSSSYTPLFVLDGMPIDGSSLRTLNPQDFESVTVLKDASATSIYGSRAANGVVYITTKQGKSSDGKGTITVKYQYGISKFADTSYFESMMNSKELTDLWVDLGLRTRASADELLQRYPHNTEWYKFYYKESAPLHQADISFSGGNTKSRYYISGSYISQEGMAYRSDFERFTFRTNLNAELNKWLKVGTNISIGYDEYQTNPYGSNSTNRGLSLLAPPFYTPYDENGNEYDYIPGWNRYNPKYLERMMPNPIKDIALLPSGYLQINPIEGLTIKTQGGIELKDSRTSFTQYPSYLGSLDNGIARERFTRNQKVTFTNTAEYRFSLKEAHNISVLAGQEWIDYKYETFMAEGRGLTDDRLVLLSNTTQDKDVDGSKAEYAFQSLFGRAEYNFNEKYFADFSLRRDGSSRFGEDNRFANFWALGAMWNAKKEPFLADVSWLDNLSIKLSYGTSGNAEIGNYSSYALVGTNQYDSNTGYTISSPGNSELAWEKQAKTTFGISIELLKLLSLDLEVYNRTTSNMLVNVPNPYTSGFSSITSNVGKLQNRGIDIQLSVDAWKSGNNYIRPYVNFNYNQDKILELFQGKSFWTIANTGIGWTVGQSITYYYPIWKGVNPDNGDAEWYLPGSDTAVTTKDPDNVSNVFSETTLEQNTGIKRYAPMNGGFGLSGLFNGLSLQADFSFSLGKYLIANDNFFFENPNVFYGFNQRRSTTNFWRQAGDQTQFPRADVQFTQFDSRMISNASFLRLKNLSIGYTVPGKYLQKTNGAIKAAKIFVTGRNLLTFTKFDGIDPEIDNNITLGSNPNTRQYSIGVEISL